MNSETDTPDVQVGDILTGHFHARQGYAAFRSRGTGDWLLIYTCSGKGRFGFSRAGDSKARGEITAERGDVFLLPPHTFHDYGVHPSAKQWEIFWSHFRPRPEWMPWLQWPDAVDEINCPKRVIVTVPAARKQIEAALARMHRYAIRPNRLNMTLATNALEEACLLCALQCPAAMSIGIDPRVVQAQDYFCRSLGRAVTLNDVASEVGLSISRLCCLFHEQTGTTPQRYYEYQRMARARQLIEITTMPVKQVAREVGYANPFYFTLRFKIHTGKSPSAYRAASSA